MRFPRWLGGHGPAHVESDDDAARQAERVRQEVARVLGEVKRSIAVIEHREEQARGFGDG